MSDPKTLDADTFRFSIEPRIAAPFHDSATDHIVDSVDGRVVAVFDAHDRAVAVQEVLEAAHDVGVAVGHALGQPTDSVPLTRLGDVLRESVAGVLARPAVVDCRASEDRGGCGRCGSCFAMAMQGVDREANRAAEMEAQANREQARADAAEQMVAELRDMLETARDQLHHEVTNRHLDGDCVDGDGQQCSSHRVVDACADALSRTEAVAGRWCPVPQRPLLDGLRRCAACGVLWSVWGPSIVQPHGSMSVHGASCAACESSGPESAVFQRVEVFELVAERDAAIAARDEAVAKLTACEIAHVVEIGKVAAAERARDEVGIQYAAAQGRIKLLEGVLTDVRPSVGSFDGKAIDTALEAFMRLDAVPGDALAPVKVESGPGFEVIRAIHATWAMNADERDICDRLVQGRYATVPTSPGDALAPTQVACSHCNDTHMMDLDDRRVMCTRCPTPCQACRGGNGPFCEKTPCVCACHVKHPPSPAGASAPASGSTPAASSATSSSSEAVENPSAPRGTCDASVRALIDAARAVDRCYDTGSSIRRHMYALREALDGLRITAALEASGIDSSNVKEKQ